MANLNKALDVLDNLEKTSGRNDKISILEANKNNTILRDLLKAGLDSFITYGVTFKEFDSNGDELPYNDFLRLLEDFSSRSLTGNAAKEAGMNLFSISTPQFTKWAIRIINHDLRIGCDELTINKIWPKLIRVFELQTAEKYEPEKKKRQVIKYPAICEPKIDGQRVLIIHSDSPVIYSRSGRVYEHLLFLVDQLKALGAPYGAYDGEIIAKNWNKTNSIMRTLYWEQEQIDFMRDNVVFNIFDQLSLTVLEDGGDPTPLRDRLKKIDKWFKPSKNLSKLGGITVNSMDDIKKFYNACLKKGYEGVMVKDLDASYKLKRGMSWLKIKPEEEFDAVIVGYEEGDKSNKGKLGAFIIKDKSGATFKVGSGFKKAERDLYWQNRDSMIGKIVECVKQQECGDKGAIVSFPVFKRLRDDKNRL